MIRNGDVGDWQLPDVGFLLTSSLPSKRSNFLAQTNPVPGDEHISFDEEKHVYTFRGKQVAQSVTGLLHLYAHEFDAHEAIYAMLNGRDWETKKKKYLKEDGQMMTVDEIVEAWATNGAVQRARGTLLHFHAEQFLNGCEIEKPHSPEFQQVVQICNTLRAEGYEPFRTEFSMYHSVLECAGQADLLCRDADGNIIIVDWKRTKELKFIATQPLKSPLDNVPDCNYFLYALQLNLYAHILESKEYKFTVSRMLLGIVHPLRLHGQIIEVPRLLEELDVLEEDILAEKK